MMRMRHVISQQLRRVFRRYPFLPRITIATTLLTVAWLFVLNWGERSTYVSHVDSCHWDEWEEWPPGATPHHLVLIADPQLVDPHTYPGRPWPLSTLTEKYTDLYMARNFRLINWVIDPDSILFLGDLFDGGREWAPEKPKKLKHSQKQTLIELGILPDETPNDGLHVVRRDMMIYNNVLSRPHTHEVTPDEHNIGKDGQDLRLFVPGEDGRWNKWGHRQWLKDLQRFSRIFFEPKQLYPVQERQLFAMYEVSRDPVSIANGAPTTGWQEYATTGGKQRRMITSLPGNHDLGFGPGVQLPIRDRFHSHFGDSNRIDVIGNHSFISLDTVSLSAHSYFRSDGYETDSEQDDYKHLWLPGMQFMERLREPVSNAVADALREYYPDQTKVQRWQHEVTDTELVEAPIKSEQEDKPKSKPNLPVVVLSHVPLFRLPDTHCGPLRESPNAIQIRMGYQYQNVLTQALSKDIVNKISEAAGDIVRVFSGDDHDYCDVVHRYNIAPSLVDITRTTLYHIREITVKSFSWAMGVKRPGFLLVSLWNPVDQNGIGLGGPETATMQTHLCLLPNQLGIFLDYAMLFVLTLILLVVDTIYWSPRLAPSLGTEDNPLSPRSASRMSLPRFKLGLNGSTDAYASKAAVKSRPRGTSTSSSQHSRNNSALLSVQRNYTARTRSVSPDIGGPLVEKAGYYPPVRWTNDVGNDSDEELYMNPHLDSQAKWKWRRRTRMPEKFRVSLEDMAFKLLLVGLPSGLYYLFLVRNG